MFCSDKTLTIKTRNFTKINSEKFLSESIQKDFALSAIVLICDIKSFFTICGFMCTSLKLRNMLTISRAAFATSKNN